MPDLAGKVAIVTGGGTGIGAAIGMEMAKAGATVVLAGRRPDVLQTAAAAIREATPGAAVHCIKCDIRSKESCQQLVQQSIDIGPVHILVNNAGIGGEVALVENYPDDDWDEVFNTNVRSNFYLCKAVIPHFRQRYEAEKEKDTFTNHLHIGAIIVMSSIAGQVGRPRLAPYSASNWARIGFAKSLALELTPIRVTVNCVCPGWVYTPIWDSLTKCIDPSKPVEDVFQEWVTALCPMKRPQTAEEVARLTLFLATQPNMTAQDVCLDGGFTFF
eukprot:EG_transcript_20398